MEQPCEEVCQQILEDIDFWTTQPFQETDSSRGRWCNFASKLFGRIRCATDCPLCRLVFQALMSVGSSGILTDETKIYYAHELLVEYEKIPVKGNTSRLKETSFQSFQIKYLKVSTCPAHRDLSRTFAWIGVGGNNGCCEANITRTYESNHRDSEFLFYERPTTPQVDTQRIKQWLASCDANHPECRTSPSALEADFWMINVRLGMLERVGLNSTRYAALSFCHGAGYCFFFDDGNAQDFQTRGFLSRTNGKIPKTIRDAISVTAALDLEYLWVDTLCIRQMSNSSVLKPYLEIYRQGYVTLVATGEDADSGLFGIESSERKVQVEESYGRLRLAVARKSVDEIMQESEWNYRRWTFEEDVQSKRILIFSEEQVFFNCQQSFWAEGVWLEGFHVELFNDISHRPVESRCFLRNWPKRLLDFSFEAYTDLVENYSKRDSFQPAHHLKAFESFSSSPHIIAHKLPLFYGLPRESMFSEALCFEVYDGVRPESERQDVPSWSWLYWNTFSGVEFSNPDTKWKQEFYQIMENTGNHWKTEKLKWSPIGEDTNGDPIKHSLTTEDLTADQINRIIGAFSANTIVLRFHHWSEGSPGVAVLGIDEFEPSATLSPSFNATYDKEIKALLVMIDDQDFPPHYNFLLLEEGPAGIFQRVGMCKMCDEVAGWMEDNLKEVVSLEDIFIH